MSALDKFDLAILTTLQSDARQSLAEVAGKAGLSPSPTWRRIRALEESGVIERQVAILNPQAVGLSVSAFVQVVLSDHSPSARQLFEDFVANDNRIVDCATVTGKARYIMSVLARSAEELEHFINDGLLATGVVREASTDFVLRRVKRQTALPLPEMPDQSN